MSVAGPVYADNIILVNNSVLTNENILSSIAHFYNYPNLFNPETTIKYSLNENSNIQIEIFNTKG